MPHIHVEFTANLAGEVDRSQLVPALHAAAVDLGVFPTWGIRVFATPVERYAAGDGDPANGFVQVQVRIAPGRPLEVRRRVAEALFQAMERALGPALAHRRFGMQLEVQEFDAPLTLQRTSLSG